MNNLLRLAQHIPVNPEVPVISVYPITLSAPNRGMDLEVRISAPVEGDDLPVILLSHGHGPSLYIPSAQGYGPIASFWAAHGFVVIQPTHLNAKARGMDPEAAGGPAGNPASRTCARSSMSSAPSSVRCPVWPAA